MREKWKKYVEKFKSLGDKVLGVKGITAIIPAVCLAVLMVTVLTGYKTPQAKKYEASETEDISQIKEALAKESTAAMAETTKKNTTKKGADTPSVASAGCRASDWSLISFQWHVL